MSQSQDSKIFSDCSLQQDPTTTGNAGILATGSVAIVRGVLMAASGVMLRLSASRPGTALAGASSANDGVSPYQNNPKAMLDSTVGSETQEAFYTGGIGGLTGTVDVTDGTAQFELLLIGHKGPDVADMSDKILSCSFNLDDANYFANVLNTDPLKLQEKGHYLYSHYDVPTKWASVTSKGIKLAGEYSGSADVNHPAAFITTGALARNSSNALGEPNFESFRDRYQTAKTPYITSQFFGGEAKSLFRVHALDDGSYPNERFKVSIRDIDKKNESFTLQVRSFNDTDDDAVVLETFRDVTLDPEDSRYVGKIIGDRYVYFNFDAAKRAQKLIQEGNYPNQSNIIRVSLSDYVKNGQAKSDKALPFGFRGYDYLHTRPFSNFTPNAQTGNHSFTAKAPLANVFHGTTGPVGIVPTFRNYVTGASVPPVPFRETLRTSTSGSQFPTTNTKLYWGVQFQLKKNIKKPNTTVATEIDATVRAYTKYFPNFEKTNAKALREEKATTIANSNLHNEFNLGNIQVTTGSNKKADPFKVHEFDYKRKTTPAANETTKQRGFESKDLEVAAVKSAMKFSLFFQGGFDGVNMFDKNIRDMTDVAVQGEIDDDPTDRGGKSSGPTANTYKKALDVMGNLSDVDIKLLAIPGIHHQFITDDAIATVEDRFDAMYIMDVQTRDKDDKIVTSSLQIPDIHVGKTVDAFRDRGLDTNFAAAYFPNVIMSVTDAAGKIRQVEVPASAAVLGAYSLNDSIGFPWFAPAGLSRGRLVSSTDVTVRLNNDNLDDLYESDINPIIQTANDPEPIVFGQKTMQAARTALDRVNVRRLLIELRREVKTVANRLLFEPNRAETLGRFTSLVTPILKRVQAQAGVERYKVQIDTTTTTQTDVENNTIRGKIFVQPTRTAEFISLDFVVTNTIAD
jgi:hypothetical protein